jgi:hypothetical protein
MLAAGATAEMIVSVVEADYQAEQEKQAVKRARDAERKRNQRPSDSVGQTGKTRNPQDSADTTPEIPPKKKSNPPVSPDTLRVSTPKQRGSRLDPDYQPSENLFNKARENFGLSTEVLKFETEGFRDHFLAQSGPRAVKLDWDRTWMNWMREAKRREKKPRDTVVPFKPTGGPRRTWAEIKAERDAQKDA